MSDDEQPTASIGLDTGSRHLNSWAWRRLFLICTQLFYMGTIQLLIWKNAQGPVAETIAWGCLGGTITNCTAYVFGAVWEANKTRSVLGQQGTAASLGVTVPQKPTPTVVVQDRRGPAPAPTAAPTTVTTTVTTQPAVSTSTADDPLVTEKS